MGCRDVEDEGAGCQAMRDEGVCEALEDGVAVREGALEASCLLGQRPATRIPEADSGVET
eukprot:1554394-Rhodomonas_salina.2